MTSGTRRDFLKGLGQGAIALVGVRFLSGCEDLTFESKLPGGALPFITPAEDGSWYWQSGNGTSKSDAPRINKDDWSLEIRDDGGTLGTLDFGDLQTYAEQGHDLSYWKTMRCVFSGSPVGSTTTSSWVANGIFGGIPLYHVLQDVGAPSDAAKIRTSGADGFQSNIPMARALEEGTSPLPPLLAYQLNGEPLSRLRGGPVRLVIPEMWGYKNIKWLDRLTVTDDDAIFGTYETVQFDPEKTAWSEADQRQIDHSAEIALASVVSQPSSIDAEVAGPDVTVAGASFAGGQRVDSVEISLDGGPFEEADFAERDDVLDALDPHLRDLADRSPQSDQEWPYPGVWITWHKVLSQLSTGRHTLAIRASDASGVSQSSSTDQSLEVAEQVEVSFKVI